MAVAPYRRVGIPTVRSVSADNNKPEFDGEWVRLGDLLTEYKELNVGNRYRPVAVGRFGIRAREDIYTKELAKDYSKNKVIHQNTLTVGMGSKQIDIGILTSEDRYSVSPAYHTYRICEVDCDYLRYCLEARNADMFKRFAKRGTRQGKTIDLKRWLGYRIYLPSKERQVAVVRRLDAIERQIDNCKSMGQRLDDLVKSQFAEMFGDVRANPYGFEKCCLKDVARDKLSYGSSCSSVPYDGETRYLRITDIADDGRLNSDVRSPSHMSEKYLLNDGDLLFARSGATVGKTYRYKKGDGRAIYAGYLIRLVPDTDIVLPDYLFWYTKTDFYSSFVSNAQRAVAQPNINAQEYGSLELLVPPLDEQRRFVSFVARVDKLGFRRPISIGAYVSDSQGRLINLAVSRVAYRRKVIVNEEISSPIRTSR